MYTAKTFTLEDAARLGYTHEQVDRMIDKINKMPKNHKFSIGPVGCPEEHKLLFRLEKYKNQGSKGFYMIYRLVDDEVNKQMVIARNPKDLVLGILKRLEHWERTLQAHRDVQTYLNSLGKERAEEPYSESTEDSKPGFISKACTGIKQFFTRPL